MLTFDANVWGRRQRTEFFLNDLKDFLAIEFLWQTLNGGQGFASISLCSGGTSNVSMMVKCLTHVGCGGQ
jgi:hypothetical protein